MIPLPMWKTEASAGLFNPTPLILDSHERSASGSTKDCLRNEPFFRFKELGKKDSCFVQLVSHARLLRWGDIDSNTITTFGKRCIARTVSIFSAYLESFAQLEPLRDRVLLVLNAIPREVQQDFLGDSRFTVSLDNYVPGKGSKVFIASPGTASDGSQTASRSVVLKPKLADCSVEFATYVIAHEFAHAFLRNGPWGEITDIEEAADALAASWGFPKPQESPWALRWSPFAPRK